MESLRYAHAAGARRVGWKIGFNAPAVQERLGITGPVVGWLTHRSVEDPDSAHSLRGGAKIVLEAEVFVRLVRDIPPHPSREEITAAIGGLGPALEIVDFDRPIEDVEAVVAGNVFHRAVIFGPETPSQGMTALAGVKGRLEVDGEPAGECIAAESAGDVVALLAFAAGLLDSCGERMRAGDRVICGAILPTRPLAPGEHVRLDLGPLGHVEITTRA
jgi:2-keto-4-pentenoate hydratase